MQHSNLDLDNIVTPVDAVRFKKLLEASGYSPKKMEFLFKGFSEGFDIQYEGPKLVRRTAPNLKLRVGSPVELWNKMMVEVKDNRSAGPFEKPPFE